MHWIIAWHVIFMVTWFAGLFYLPRLYVYHAMSEDEISHERFKIMERKLFYGITTPGAVLTTVFGIWLLSYDWHGFLSQTWLQLKLILVALLWIYHFVCLKYLLDFKYNRNKHSHVFYRFFNEVPVVILIAVIILAFVHPEF